MVPPVALLAGLIGITIVLIVILIVRPAITTEPGGKMLAFVVLFFFPALALLAGGLDHIERSKRTEFCLSCHVMGPYGKSLHVNDSEYLPAVHYQNNFVPHDEACYTCHTDYALYGDVRAKFRGLRHVMVYYFGTIPDTIRLYTPYNNRECLHCHGVARKFQEASGHRQEETLLADVRSGKRSCLEAGCHDVAHDVRGLADAEMWKEGKQ